MWMCITSVQMDSHCGECAEGGGAELLFYPDLRLIDSSLSRQMVAVASYGLNCSIFSLFSNRLAAKIMA